MGILLSLFSGSNTGRIDDPDPITTLTSRDKYLIQSSWARIRTNATANGVTLLMLFFEMYPDEIRHFPFRDVPLAELPANKKFQAHCHSIMYAFSSIVDSVNDGELLVNILQKIGDAHERRNAAKKSFNNLKSSLMALFAKVMSKNEVEAWDKTLKVAFSVMANQLTN